MTVHRSSPRSNRVVTLLLTLLAALALVASACGSGDTATIEAGAESATSDVAESAAEPDLDDPATEDLALVDDDAASDSDAAAADDAATADDDDGDGGDAAAADADESTEEAASVEAPAAADDGSLVLARAAAQASQDQTSYRIEQGMGLQMSLLDGFIEMDISPDTAIAMGEVSGDSSHMVMDLGAFMSEMLSSASPLGAGPTDAELAEMLEIFDGAQIETWQVGQTLYMDMSAFLGAIEDVEPVEDETLGALADGPVRIELDQLGLTGTQAANGLGQGMSVVDPAALLDALIAVEAVAETGTAVVRGVDTTVYTGSTTMSAYAEATGVNVGDQLGPLADMGLGDGLVRRIEVILDMAPMMMAMFSDPALLGETIGEAPSEAELAQLQALLGDDLLFVSETWQEFYDYGETFTFEPPADAVDITDDYPALVESGVLDA